MELLLAVIGGLVLGAIAHVVLPWRSSRGVLVGPAVGGIAAAVLWEALTWAGWRYDGTWIWVVALIGAGLVAVVVAWLLGTRRERQDAAYYEQLAARGA
ncbi:hypothetical protein [Curtobacterium oceanosedimentum]|uniref:hypothetical protein n=1 Tax=Curtobacterium oceanosedimentum TaxID=465820 RepID=UPI001CE18439|nr:hypothetical protein [Curtobacterium oceanosedimentum]MCA5922228.1 hypothetical protein [Curtobacterium oceanosedimentum]